MTEDTTVQELAGFFSTSADRGVKFVTPQVERVKEVAAYTLMKHHKESGDKEGQ